jgi:cytosine/adenosine deaminase-related metal-dependent hydrolase
VLPGWVQTHVHVCQTLLRNRADDLELLDWLRLRVWPYEAALEPEDLAAAADLACLELLKGGTTTILDMGTVRHQDAVFESLERSGIRAFSGKCMMDTGEGVPGPMMESTDSSLAESDRLRDRWDGAAEGRLRYAYAPRFALSCSEGLLREVAERTGGESGTLLHTHASENRTECELVREASGGRDNVDWLGDLGAEGPHVVLAHCVHLTDREIARMAEAGTRAVHCPSSNLKLASGVARVPETADAGVHWSLGADGAPCNNNLDAFVEVRLAALLHKHRVGPTAMTAPEALRLATAAGGEALGMAGEIGVLTVGAHADIQVVSLDGAHVAPSASEPDAVVGALVYAAGRGDVRHVVVDGRVVVEDGECRTLDSDGVRRRAREAWGRVRERL